MSEHEARVGEGMVRASVSTDLGALLLSLVPDPSKRALLEEVIVAECHDFFEVGITYADARAEEETGRAYLNGFFDGQAIGIEGEES